MSDLTRIILIIVLLILSGFFSMSESAFSYCNQIKLKVKADDGSKSAKLVLKTIEKFDRYIVNVLICNNIVNILFSVLATILCIKLFNEYGVLVATISSTLIVFFLGEMIPKSIAKARPDGVCCFCVYPMYVIGLILTPLSLIFSFLTWICKKIFKAEKDESIMSEDDFQDVIETIEESGQIESEESEIIQSAVDFADMKVKQVMRPKDEIVAIDVDNKMNKDELIDYLVDNNYSRIPVYKGSIDNIIGILHVRTALKSIMTNKYFGIEKHIAPPLYVKPNMHLDTIFDEFKKNKTHMGIVVDKEDKTLGIVTMEDVLEELVGDIDESEEGGVSHE